MLNPNRKHTYFQSLQGPSNNVLPKLFLFIVVILDSTAITLFHSILPFLLRQAHLATIYSFLRYQDIGLYFGLFFSVFEAGRALSVIWMSVLIWEWKVLSLRFSLFLCTFCNFIICILYTVSLFHETFALLIILRFLQGFFGNTTFVVKCICNDWSNSVQERKQYFSTWYSVIEIGRLLSTLFGGIFVGYFYVEPEMVSSLQNTLLPFSYFNASFYLTSLCLAFAVLFSVYIPQVETVEIAEASSDTLQLLQEQTHFISMKPSETSFSELWRIHFQNSNLVKLNSIYALTSAAMSSIFILWVLFLSDKVSNFGFQLDPLSIGILFFIYAALSVVAQPIANWMSNYASLKMLFFGGCALCAFHVATIPLTVAPLTLFPQKENDPLDWLPILLSCLLFMPTFILFIIGKSFMKPIIHQMIFNTENPKLSIYSQRFLSLSSAMGKFIGIALTTTLYIVLQSVQFHLLVFFVVTLLIVCNMFISFFLTSQVELDQQQQLLFHNSQPQQHSSAIELEHFDSEEQELLAIAEEEESKKQEQVEKNASEILQQQINSLVVKMYYPEFVCNLGDVLLMTLRFLFGILFVISAILSVSVYFWTTFPTEGLDTCFEITLLQPLSYGHIPLIGGSYFELFVNCCFVVCFVLLTFDTHRLSVTWFNTYHFIFSIAFIYCNVILNRIAKALLADFSCSTKPNSVSGHYLYYLFMIFVLPFCFVKLETRNSLNGREELFEWEKPLTKRQVQSRWREKRNHEMIQKSRFVKWAFLIKAILFGIVYFVALLGTALILLNTIFKYHTTRQVIYGIMQSFFTFFCFTISMQYAKKSNVYQTTWNSTIILVILLLASVGYSIVLILKNDVQPQFFLYPFSFSICFTFLCVLITAYLKLKYQDHVEYNNQ